MKKAALFLTSLVSLSLLLSACQPEDRDLAKDPAVAEKCKRCKIKGESTSNESKFNTVRGPGFFGLSAVMVEKEVEAIELVRMAMGLDDATAAGYTADTTSKAGTVVLVSNSQPQEYKTEQGTFKTSSKRTLTAVVHANPKEGVLVEITGVKLLQSVDRLEQKQYLNWGEDTYAVKLEESKLSADELVLSLVSAGTYRTAAGLNPFALTIVMRLDKSSFMTGAVKVIEAKNRLTYKYKPGAKDTLIELEGANHEIVNNGQCYTLNSISTILSDKTQKKMVYSNSAAQVADSSFKTSAAACESRPTVDLSRAFVF